MSEGFDKCYKFITMDLNNILTFFKKCLLKYQFFYFNIMISLKYCQNIRFIDLNNL